jgi:enoyl-CoA hydratase
MSRPYDKYSRLQITGPEDGLLTIVLGTGDQINSVDGLFHTELATIWHDIDTDPHTRAVILKGPSPAGFLSGGSLEYAQLVASSSEARFQMLDEQRRFIYGILNCSKPLISAIAGQAIGEGVIIGLLSDISIVGPSTTLLDRHVPLGVVAGDHAALIWPLLCGMAKAKYHLLMGEPITGAEAERIGLVSVLVDDDAEVLTRAEAIGQKLVGCSATAVSWTKYTLNNWLRLAGPSFDASLGLELLGFAHPDFSEALSAARAGRPPVFNR